MCDLASKIPYKKAAASMAVQHSIKISTKRFWAVIQAEATLISDVLADESKALYTKAIEPQTVDLKGEKPLIIGIDGGWVRGWKNNQGFEVRCATMATGSASGPGKQRHLQDRVGYASLCSIEEFRKRISTLAIKSGYLTASSRVFVSDGAPWIANMVDDYFPEAIHVLDMFHLKHKIDMLFGIKAEGATANIRDKALCACNAYNPKAIFKAVASWQVSETYKAEQQADLLTYINNNALAIQNHKLVSIHGSGWIEKGVDLMISRRMKNRGMAWTQLGSSHIIPLAVLNYNKQWGVYWNKRKGFDSLVAV
jgi:hypothetical protein